jgi:hypothetical protein
MRTRRNKEDPKLQNCDSTEFKIDARKVDVKFEACRLTLRNSRLDVNFPLGVVGLKKWMLPVPC